jgi:tetratricopeptide (TPR) repeat protein
MISCSQLIPLVWKELTMIDEWVKRIILDAADKYEGHPDQFMMELEVVTIAPNIEKAYSLWEAALLLSDRHYYSLSIRVWEHASAYFEIAGDKQSQSSCYINLGNDYSRLENFEKAIEYYEKAIDIALENGFKDVELNCHIYTGLVYFALAKYNIAIEYYEKAIDIALENGFKDAVLKGYNSIAACYTKLNNLQKAEEFREKAENFI